VGPDTGDSSADNVVFSLIVLIALTIVPVMIGWWFVVLRHLHRRSEAAIRTSAGRWHPLRYGPTAPLISAAVFLCGLPSWNLSRSPGTIPASLGLPLMVMAVSGLAALVISATLWAFTRSLERSIAAPAISREP